LILEKAGVPLRKNDECRIRNLETEKAGCLFTPEQCAEMSVPDTTVRLSIGLEAGEDLLEDIKNSLRQ